VEIQGQGFLEKLPVHLNPSRFLVLFRIAEIYSSFPYQASTNAQIRERSILVSAQDLIYSIMPQPPYRTARNFLAFLIGFIAMTYIIVVLMF
jgi:hypothetical protein